MADAVKVTLGPRGRYALLDKKFGAPTITNDGVTIARDIELEDPFENMGAQLLEEVAAKTNDIAGDGTTTSIVLAQAIITEGLKNVTAGANPMALKRGIERASSAVVDEIKRLRKPVESKDDIAHIAAISARDTEIGKLIAEVMEKVGKDGVVTVEESQGLKLDKEYVEGMQLDRGYISRLLGHLQRRRPHGGRPRAARTSSITDKKISAVADILPTLEKVVGSGRPLLIMAEDVDGEALPTLVVNKLRGTHQRAGRQGAGLRRSPQGHARGHRHPDRWRGSSPRRSAASSTASQLEDLGQARRVTATKDTTTIVEGKGDPRARSRPASARSSSRSTTPPATSTARSSRSAWPSSPAAWRCSRSARPPRSSSRRRSTASRTRCRRPVPAVEEGMVAGGGSVLLHAHPGARQARGARVTRRPASTSCAARSRSRCARSPINAGVEGSVVVDAVRKLRARQRLRRAEGRVRATCSRPGIIDPAKVTRSALENAASVASLMLTTETIITDIPEKEKAPMPGMGGGMDY